VKRQSQSHVRWYCRYHVIIVPKYRKKAMFGVLRKDTGVILKDQCKQFEGELVEGHAMSDHIHMFIHFCYSFISVIPCLITGWFI
jgi:putative transposase